MTSTDQASTLPHMPATPLRLAPSGALDLLVLLLCVATVAHHLLRAPMLRRWLDGRVRAALSAGGVEVGGFSWDPLRDRLEVADLRIRHRDGSRLLAVPWSVFEGVSLGSSHGIRVRAERARLVGARVLLDFGSGEVSWADAFSAPGPGPPSGGPAKEGKPLVIDVERVHLERTTVRLGRAGRWLRVPRLDVRGRYFMDTGSDRLEIRAAGATLPAGSRALARARQPAGAGEVRLDLLDVGRFTYLDGRIRIERSRLELGPLLLEIPKGGSEDDGSLRLPADFRLAPFPQAPKGARGVLELRAGNGAPEILLLSTSPLLESRGLRLSEAKVEGRARPGALELRIGGGKIEMPGGAELSAPDLRFRCSGSSSAAFRALVTLAGLPSAVGRLRSGGAMAAPAALGPLLRLLGSPGNFHCSAELAGQEARAGAFAAREAKGRIQLSGDGQGLTLLVDPAHWSGIRHAATDLAPLDAGLRLRLDGAGLRLEKARVQARDCRVKLAGVATYGFAGFRPAVGGSAEVSADLDGDCAAWVSLLPPAFTHMQAPSRTATRPRVLTAEATLRVSAKGPRIETLSGTARAGLGAVRAFRSTPAKGTEVEREQPLEFWGQQVEWRR